MKFNLTKVDKVPTHGRTEDRYRYDSEDGKHHCSFHADSQPWTFVTEGNLEPTVADRLVDKFCEMAMNDANPKFEDRVRQLEIQL